MLAALYVNMHLKKGAQQVEIKDFMPYYQDAPIDIDTAIKEWF